MLPLQREIRSECLNTSFQNIMLLMWTQKQTSFLKTKFKFYMFILNSNMSKNECIIY